MSDSREESPDWLRSFQLPTRAAIELSSGSESPLESSPLSDDEDGINLSKLFKKEATQVSDTNVSDKERESVVKPVKGKSPKKSNKVKRTPERKNKIEKASAKEGKKAKENDAKRRNALEKDGKSHDHTIWSLSSDSESSPDTSLTKKRKVIKKELSTTKDLLSENMDYDLLEHAEESPKLQISKAKIPVEKLQKEDVQIAEGNAKSVLMEILITMLRREISPGRMLSLRYPLQSCHCCYQKKFSVQRHLLSAKVIRSI